MMQFSRAGYSIAKWAWLAVLVGAAICIAAFWRETDQLRRELRQLHAQLGQLEIENPDLPHAIRVNTSKPNTWKWRVYLPPLPFNKYVVNCITMAAEPPTPELFPNLLEEVRRRGRNSQIHYTDDPNLEGEITIEAALIDRESYGYLQVRPIGGAIVGLARDIDKVEDLSSQLTGINSSHQTVYGRGEPILLLCLVEPPVRLVSDTQTGPPPPRIVMLWIQSVD